MAWGEMNTAVKYLYSVTCICLLGGIICFLGYSLDNKRQRVYLKYIKEMEGRKEALRRAESLKSGTEVF